MCFSIVCAVSLHDTPPEQSCMLPVARLFGKKSEVSFSWGTETLSVCFFIPVLDQKHTLCARRGIIPSDAWVQNLRLGPGLPV